MIEWIALAIELLAVAVILAAILSMALPRGGTPTAQATLRTDEVTVRKHRMGRGLLLGLELLLAADIVGTIAVRPTLRSLAALGLLALIRSFLSWSLDVEINGCWPWRLRAERAVVPDVESSAVRE